MADNNFFYQLKEKLRALSPSDQHQTEDWAILKDQLDSILPVQSNTRPIEWISTAVLLFILLVLSNFIWWSTSQIYTNEQLAKVADVSNQTIEYSKSFNSRNKPDTIWQTLEEKMEYADLTKNESIIQPLSNSQTKESVTSEYNTIFRQQDQLVVAPFKISTAPTYFRIRPLSESSTAAKQSNSITPSPLPLLPLTIKPIEHSNSLLEKLSSSYAP